jgi:hypothetical protein
VAIVHHDVHLGGKTAIGIIIINRFGHGPVVKLATTLEGSKQLKNT